VTRKKVRPIPTDGELVRSFTGQAFKDVLVANWPGAPADATRAKPEEVAKYAESVLLEARVYARDAIKPEMKTTADRPQRKPIIEAAISFAMGLQLIHTTRTGEQPSFTANRADPGPFARILRWFLLEIKAPPDAVTYINELQHRSNTMTDARGQPRRKRKRREPIPET
jgi:hypothetical protein